MKMGPDVLGTAKNEYGRAKHLNGTQHPQNSRQRVWVRKTRKRDPSPPVPLKMSPGAQNVKTGPDALGTAENMFGSEKHENEKVHPRYRRKRVQARKTRKWDPMPLYRRKRVRARKT
jgi:hypothetical protein